jgi:hypothetical protein
LNTAGKPLHLFKQFALAAIAMLAYPNLLLGAAAATAPVDAPRPDFVTPQTVPAAEPAEIAKAENGEYFLLVDNQIRVDRQASTHYRRIVRKVTDRAGLEGAGRLEFEFDPSEDALALHAVRVSREGAVVAEIGASAFKVIQREADLADGITDGELTAFAELPDIRVGDVIDYEISWLTRSQIWPGEYFSDFSVQWSEPTGRYHWKAILPPDKPLTIRARGDAPTVATSKTPENLVYEVSVDKPTPVRGEEAVPDTFATWSRLSVSTLATWSDVVETLLGAYEADAALPDELAARIVPARGAIEEKITRAIRYVQDEIRYVADESGVGSHLPRAPGEVVSRGWGDCKDKALLLVAILRALGVEAHVALTDNEKGRALPQFAPSPYAFNHAVVVIDYKGERRWIDATFTHQGGVFPSVAPPVYGYALALGKGVNEFWPIAAESLQAPDFRVAETFDFAAKETEGVRLTVKSEMRGGRADGFRQSFAAESLDSLKKKYFDYYGGLYEGLTIGADPVVTDDRDANLITVAESYILPAAAFTDELKASFVVKADAINNAVASFGLTGRRAPISLPFPFHAEHIVALDNTGIDMDGIDGADKTTPDYEFVRDSKADKGSLRISWRFKTLADEIPPARVDDYRFLTGQMDDWNALEYDLGAGAAGGPSALEWLALVSLAAAILAAGVLIFFGLRARDADLATIDRSTLYPMDLRKFLILGVATLGFYAVVWMYRCWRHIRRAEDRQINPAVRAFFGVIFYFPLFDEIRRRLPEGARPATALGIVLAAAYFILSIVSSAADRIIKDAPAALAGLAVSDAAIFLLVVPLLLWTNRLNAANPDVIAEHSKWRGRTFAMLAFGLTLWPLLIAGALSPE